MHIFLLMPQTYFITVYGASVSACKQFGRQLSESPLTPETKQSCPVNCRLHVSTICPPSKITDNSEGKFHATGIKAVDPHEL